MRQLAAARGIARLLDGLRLDPLLGLLLPAVGDVLTGACGLGIVGLAAHARVPKVVLARMLLNLSLDTALGALPLIGDAFDFWFRAHERNVRLFERASREPSSHALDWLVLAAAALAFVAAMALPVLALVWLMRAAVRGAL